jgi:site-specific DNA-methyltransferase (adenine-specific)/site-specific DNA-methyltransferase (cytosine-N4-specific)
MRPEKLDIIYNGNCENYLSNGLIFPNNSIDLIITSPPYAERRKDSYGGIEQDKYIKWFLPIAKQLYSVLKPKGSFVLNIKENVKNGQRQTYVLELILELKKQGWLWIEEYCWYKKNSYPGKWPNRFRDSWERCLHFTKQNEFKMYQDSVKVPIGDWSKQRFKSMAENDFIRHVSKTDSKFGRKVSNWLNKKKVYPHNVIVFENEHYIDNPTNVLHFATECSNRNHSAVFPVELPSWFIKLFTKKGDIILDPFMGIGTTALASILLERRFIGIEVMNKYVKEARKNIKDLKKIVRVK